MITPALAPLCPPCQAERSRWLDYRLPPALSIAYGSGAPHDVSQTGIRDRRLARGEEWRATVCFQRALIARTCREQGHAAVPTVPRVIELPLFDLIGEVA